MGDSCGFAALDRHSELCRAERLARASDTRSPRLRFEQSVASLALWAAWCFDLRLLGLGVAYRVNRLGVGGGRYARVWFFAAETLWRVHSWPLLW